MAKKLKSNFKNMFLVLLVTTVVSALVLSMTYNATKDPIEKAKETKQRAAVEKVISGFDEMKECVVTDASGNEMKIFDCLKDGESIGVAVQSYTMLGFSGRIDVMVGFLPDGTITETVILKHLETPGLGDKLDISKHEFPRQFWDKNIADLRTGDKIQVTKDGGKIDAITAATISSRAFCDAVDRAWEVYQSNNK
ncbi:MAG: RnfABCDGE type electron transport complex subunit G [Bacteroidales bacterium]|nr:RnfABCDGE type electron transport complex subunit G [Bacteroidales bacterium]